MKRAILYARVSGDDRDNEGRNLIGQLDMCREYAQTKGWHIVAELAEDDRGASGASFELPQLNEALDMARSGAFEVLIVREIDRLSRRLAKQLIVEEEFKRANVQIEYVIGDYADSPEGALMKNVRAVIAEYEREKITERTTRGRRQKVKAGHVLTGGPPPYGYRLVENDGGNSLAIDEKTAPVICMIFDWYSGDENVTLREVARRLSEMKIPTATDLRNDRRVVKKRPFGEWSVSTVGVILRNETYAGLWHYGKRNREGQNPEGHRIAVKVPAIIDRETWRRAQARREQNRRELRRRPQCDYLLRRRAICGACGVKMVCQSYKPDTIRYSYYRCPALGETLSYAHSCKMPQFRSDQVDAAIWGWIRQLLSDPAALQLGLEGYRAEREKVSEPLRQRLAVIEDILADSHEQLTRLLDLFLDGAFPKELLVERKKRLETTIHQLEEEYGKLSAEINAESLTQGQIQTLREFAAEVAEGLDKADRDFDVRRNIIGILDLKATLAVEDGEQVVYAQGVFGQESLRFKDSLSGGAPRHRRPLQPDWPRPAWTECC